MITDFILDYFEENIYIALSFISFFSQLGVPLGATFFVMYSGSIIDNSLKLLLVISCVFVLMFIGDIIAYKIGEKFGRIIFNKYRKYKIISKSYNKSKSLMKKYGPLSVFLTRFLITGLGPTINYLAGLEKFNFKTFLLFIILGELIYAFVFVFLGFIFKETFEELLSIISDFSTLIILIVISFLIIQQIYKNIRNYNVL